MTPREQRFSEVYASSGDAVYAARQAGYAESCVHPQVSKLKRNPTVMADYEARCSAELKKLGPKAVRRLGDSLDTLPPGTALNKAIEITLKWVFAPTSDLTLGELHEMKPEDLERLRQRMFDELAARAKPVRAQDAPTEPSQAVDIYD